MLLIFKAIKIVKEKFDSSIIEKMNIVCINSSKNLQEGNDAIIKNVEIKKINELFEDADEFGSLIKVPEIKVVEGESKVIQQYKILSQKYDVVCTNPPYMGKKNINKKLSEFLKDNYPDTKSEMYAAFIERCLDFTVENGYLAMITIHSWMFISSFKN